MANIGGAPESIRLITPATDEQWRLADTLIDELKEWDVLQSRPLGFEREEILSVFYPSDASEVRRDSAPPDGSLLIAMDGSSPVGCAAFRRLTAEVCELYNVYVRPTRRGAGVASMLLQKLMSDATAAGYASMRLETATFMDHAHRLYKTNGFKVRAPYRSLAERFAAVTIWMEAQLVRRP
jgi:ribosomal protein S18 acetylase RimI-like enzyme